RPETERIAARMEADAVRLAGRARQVDRAGIECGGGGDGARCLAAQPRAQHADAVTPPLPVASVGKTRRRPISGRYSGRTRFGHLERRGKRLAETQEIVRSSRLRSGARQAFAAK